MQRLQGAIPARQTREPIEKLGMEGASPRCPKSLDVADRPRPKWYCQTRLTITRVESGLSGRLSQRRQ